MMEAPGILAILSAAFGLGMLHALDADHIAAVANLAGNGQDRRKALLTSFWWAMGHGLALMSLGAGMLILGMAIPEQWSAVAEDAVAIALIVIGAWVLWDLNRRGVHLHFHRHDDRVLHGHLHAHDVSVWRWTHARDPHAHDHGAVLVGLMHGTAGSAPVLALVPVSQMGSPWIGIAYLVLFGLGVLAAMIIFGGLLGGVMTWLRRWGSGLITALRSGVALGAISLGAHMLYVGG
ncbi:MAG: sulfite exporter TauE/SafE family protein [Gammaproteobacteria bacterium]